MKKYFSYWTKISALSAQTNLQQRGGAAMFIAGKLVRFGTFFLLLILIEERVNQVSGYTLKQLIIFFMFFNFFDIAGQLFFRGIYNFRQQIISGEFDFRLIKPLSPLFQALTRHTDPLDIPLLFIVIIYLVREAISIPFFIIFPFIILTASGLLVITAIHITIASLGILTTEIDHTVMIYRDLSSMARVPTDIYALPIRAFLTFILPITVAYTIPAKAFLGLLDIPTIATSLGISIIFFLLSIKTWNFALTKYSSASS